MKKLSILTLLFILLGLACNNNLVQNQLVEVTAELDKGRTVLPEVEFVEFKLYGNRSGEAENLMLTVDDLSKVKLQLTEGTWDFRLEAYLDFDMGGGANRTLFSTSSLTDQGLGSSAVNLQFTLNPPSAGQNPGKIQINLDCLAYALKINVLK